MGPVLVVVALTAFTRHWSGRAVCWSSCAILLSLLCDPLPPAGFGIYHTNRRMARGPRWRTLGPENYWTMRPQTAADSISRLESRFHKSEPPFDPAVVYLTGAWGGEVPTA